MADLDSFRDSFFSMPIGSAPLPDPKALETEPAHTPAPQNDPLIATGWEKIIYLGVILIVLAVLVLVGFLSRKIEHVLALALIMSLVLIGAFLILRP